MWCIYVMSNPAMPGLVKIGGSYDPEIRAAQLSSTTSVPLPFKVEFSDWHEFGREVEQEAHRILEGKRVNPSREFFKVSVDEAARVVQVACLIVWWNRTSPDARREFLGRIDSPLMDRRWE